MIGHRVQRSAHRWSAPACFAAISSALVLTGCGAVGERPTTLQRADEVDEIVASLLEDHPLGRELADRRDFQEVLAELRSEADDVSLPRYVEGLRTLFALVGDGHTAVLASELGEGAFARRLPIRVELFHDGAYVVAAGGPALPLLGKRITRFAGVSTGDLLRRFVRTANGDNLAFKARWAVVLFSRPALVEGLGLSEQRSAGTRVETIPVEAVDSAGTTTSVHLVPDVDAGRTLVRLDRLPNAMELIARRQPAFAETHYPLFTSLVDGERALYVSLSEMGDQPGLPFGEFTRHVTDAMSRPGVQRMIVDLRQNGGGNNMLAEPLRREIVRSRFNRPGGLYVLVGRKTFSAGMNFATRLERETDALFVGEPTGGSPNHFGDATFREAPVTGVPYLVSTLFWQDSAPFDNRRWILPDVRVPERFVDFLEGRDAGYEAALRYEASADEFRARRIMAPWERKTQAEGWRFFFE